MDSSQSLQINSDLNVKISDVKISGHAARLEAIVAQLRIAIAEANQAGASVSVQIGSEADSFHLMFGDPKLFYTIRMWINI